jgi:hypothetical protein
MTKAPKTMRMVPKARSCNRIFRPCTREIQTSAHQQIAKESGRTLFCGYREMFAPTISSLVMNGVRYRASWLSCVINKCLAFHRLQDDHEIS